MHCDKIRDDCIPGNLRMHQQGVELLSIEVMQGNCMSCLAESQYGSIRNGMVETPRAGMGKYDGDLHGPSHFLAVALKNV
jgi:hypothetical protein